MSLLKILQIFQSAGILAKKFFRFSVELHRNILANFLIVFALEFLQSRNF